MSSNQFNNKKVYSVSNITSHIQQLFKSDPLLQNVTIVGELSNFKYHSSGHMYFVLKDDKSQIKCVMFRGSNLGLSFNPCDGMGVRATGDIRVYEKRGEYQFYVMQMVEVGKGALFAAFEQLKLKLKAEGLFRQDIKKTLPKIPRKIAVITSPTGAAIRDIISVTLRRFPNIHIIVVPAQVQGNEAASQISDNIKFLNKVLPNLDFIIIGRGGGSIEELWAFNEEILAREIYHSTIPIVSAVGHETDFTISDFVADLRAPTPSGAAEMTIPDMESLVMNVSLVRSKLNRMVKYILELKEQKYFTVFESLRYQNPKSKIMQHTQTLDDLITRLNLNMKHIININENILNKYREKIITLSPKGVLKRGYSICFKIPERTIIKKTKQIKKNDNIDVMVSDGIISANVTERRSVNE
ncbi:MAG: exodeoxyribonuclease VII large subunit [Atribacterota bacterium]|jgi:exodeoxyribonuclease VII large subunit|nr:exodeoxyribonuclease VII large subunit [Atribacterota bacterium]MDD4288733.1 exodeoxyribonuclease VII large subunit [Atribacterota bacterium]MDD4764697.1 exodeoxyribonuclease VII large subunit [Atribacterota bacterium]